MTRTLTKDPDIRTDPAESASDLVSHAIKDQSALQQIRRHGMLGLGESYMDGLWDVERLDAFIYQIFTSPPDSMPIGAWSRLLLAAFAQRTTDRQAGRGAFKIGTKHYDLGNELFRVMLDSSMTYTSGYWLDVVDLDGAQHAKLELLCRKLDLKPGMRVLDIGCGWGNFAHHAAAEYGVHVTGITVSEEQAKVASERCQGMEVDIRVQDYRELSGTFDRIVSIEMIEAVGRRNISKFFNVVKDCLADEGLFAMQVISGDMLSRTSDRRMDQFVLWLLKYIFPDGYLPHARELADLRGTGMRVEDWHCFSDDYDRTLMAWSARFNQGWDGLANRYDERFRRQWNYYLHGCAAAFRAGLINVQQIVYSRGCRTDRYRPAR